MQHLLKCCPISGDGKILQIISQTIRDKIKETKAVSSSFFKQGPKGEMVTTLQQTGCKVATFAHMLGRERVRFASEILQRDSATE